MTEQGMRFGVVLPGGTAGEQVEQAVLAEQSGWDGVFVWETGSGVDAWSLLAAMAVSTSRVRGEGARSHAMRASRRATNAGGAGRRCRASRVGADMLQI